MTVNKEVDLKGEQKPSSNFDSVQDFVNENGVSKAFISLIRVFIRMYILFSYLCGRLLCRISIIYQKVYGWEAIATDTTDL